MRTTGRPPFGGTTSRSNLNPYNLSPPRGYRIIPGRVWWKRLNWPWRQYIAAHATGMSKAIAPYLAPATAGGIYFTDRESLEGFDSPGDFCRRVGLHALAQAECQLFGCAVIEFDIPDPGKAILPKKAATAKQQGLTVQGAREWFIPQNIVLSDAMVVTYIDYDPASGAPGYYDIPL